MSLIGIFLISFSIATVIGLLAVSFISIKKIFLKKFKFLKNEYNILEPIINSLFSSNNKDGSRYLLTPGVMFFPFIPFIFNLVIFVVIFLIFWFGSNYISDDFFNSLCIVPFLCLSLIFGPLIVLKKTKKVLNSNTNLYRKIPLDFKYEKIIFKGSQKDVKNAQDELMKIYKKVKQIYNCLRFSMFTIKNPFNYYFLYLRAIGNLLHSKKILDFLSKNENIEIIVDNRKIVIDEFKQVLLVNLFCIFYYFNFYGCSTNFLEDFQEFENFDDVKKGYKFEEIKETDTLINDGVRFYGPYYSWYWPK